MPPIHEQTQAKPYESDADYIEALASAVHARARLIGARMKARNDADEDGVGLVVAGDDQSIPSDARAKVTRLVATEQRLWSEIDSRREATKAAGRVLGLDDICDEYDLDDTERLALVLTTLPAVGLEFAEVLGDVASFGFCVMSATVDMLGVMNSLDMAGRLRLREQFGPKGKLVVGGLIAVELAIGERVQDFPTASLFITQTAFDRIVGIGSGDDVESCPSCGQPMQPEEG